MKVNKTTFFYLLLTLFVLIAPFLGAVKISLVQLFDINSVDFRIFSTLRLPRILLCFSAGASLALLGVIYQLLFHNSLAEPYVLGVSTASTLGIFLFESGMAHVTGFSKYQPLAGILVAVLYVVILMRLSKKVLRSPERVILFGMGANFFLSSVLFLLVSYFQLSVGSNSLRWLFGQVPWLDLPTALTVLGLSVLLMFYLIRQHRKVDVLSLGDGVAKSMGVDPQATRRNLLFVSSVLLGMIASSIGTVGFVGLVAPHAVRLWLKPTQTKYLFIHTLFLGGAFLVFSDAISRSLLPPIEFPVGVITTFLGGPVFLYLLWKR